MKEKEKDHAPGASVTGLFWHTKRELMNSPTPLLVIAEITPRPKTSQHGIAED